MKPQCFSVGVVHTVTFKDGLTGSVIKSENVTAGKSALAPSAPVHSGYTFTGWNGSYANVKSNVTVVANYSKNAVVPTPQPTPTPTPNSIISIKSGWWAADSNGVKVDASYRVPYTGSFLNPIAYVTNGSTKIYRPAYSPYFFKNKEPGTATVMIRGNHARNYRDSFWTKFTIASATKADVVADDIDADVIVEDAPVIEELDEGIFGWECIDADQKLYRYYDVVTGLMVQNQEYYVTLSEPGIDDSNPGIRRFDEEGYMVLGEYIDPVTGEIYVYSDVDGIKIEDPQIED